MSYVYCYSQNATITLRICQYAFKVCSYDLIFKITVLIVNLKFPFEKILKIKKKTEFL